VTLLLVHAAATWYLVGLIWFVQLVHYPLLAAVGTDDAVAYQAGHLRRTGWSLAVAWPVEGITAALLVVATPDGVPRRMPLAGIVALAGIVVSTLALQAPAHRRLSAAFDQRTHARLVRTNWIRTTLWTGRGLLALAMVAAA
jgi:hypothetical protein